jgi:hypothetical protein
MRVSFLVQLKFFRMSPAFVKLSFPVTCICQGSVVDLRNERGKDAYKKQKGRGTHRE